MKNNIKKVIVTSLIVALILAVIGFYLYDVIANGTPWDQHIFRTIAIVAMLLGTLVRLYGTAARRNLDFYEKAYAEEIGFAFQDSPLKRKKLLCACRLFNERNYAKALKYLAQLSNEAQCQRDLIPVLLFAALCYSNSNVTKEAIKIYYDLLQLDPNHAQAHSNLGYQLMKEGNYDEALKHFNKAISVKPKDYYAYSNRADYYFDLEQYDLAIADAKYALELKNNGREAAGLLTIIYALLGDEENKQKYYHVALTSGETPERLNQAIKFYLSEKEKTEEEEEDEEE